MPSPHHSAGSRTWSEHLHELAGGMASKFQPGTKVHGYGFAHQAGKVRLRLEKKHAEEMSFQRLQTAGSV